MENSSEYSQLLQVGGLVPRFTDSMGENRNISFRDPDGKLELTEDGTVYRHLTPSGVIRFLQIRALKTVQSLQGSGNWIDCQTHPQEPTRLEHPRIFFPSYPYEWAQGMLRAAGLFTINVNRLLLSEGWELKDASPYNILFRGVKPIFVDHLSPVLRSARQMGWSAYGQFQRTFHIPLLLNHRNRIPLPWMLLAHRDGVQPETAFPLLSALGRFHPSVIAPIVMPTLLHRYCRVGPTPSFSLKAGESEEDAGIVTNRILRGMSRSLNTLAAKSLTSPWSGYDEVLTDKDGHQENLAKENFLKQVLSEFRPKTMLDLGCNRGKYSRIAALMGSTCVSIDSDPECIERLYQQSVTENLDILPLQVDLGLPSPALGWDNTETLSLIERMKGKFDLTLVYALIHHLLVRERIPLDAVVQFVASTTTGIAIFEWVDPGDFQFKRIAGPSIELYKWMTPFVFRKALEKYFSIERESTIQGGTRILYLCQRRPRA